MRFVLLLLVLFAMPAFCFDDSHFFSRSSSLLASMSPSGKYLLQVERKGAHFRLVVTDLDSSEVLYNPYLGNAYPRNLVWLNDRRVMYEQGGRLVAINIDGKEHRVIFNNIIDYDGGQHSYSWFKKRARSWKVLHTLPSSIDEIIAQTTDIKGVSSVHKVNIYTGERKTIVDGKKRKINSWYTDKLGNVILGISNHKGNITIHFRQNDDEDAGVDDFSQSGEVDTKVGRVSKGEDFIYSNFSLVSGSYDPDLVYVSEALESDLFRLSSFRISTQKIEKVVHEDNEYDVGNAFNNPLLHFHKKEKRLLGVTYIRDRITTKWFDDTLLKIQGQIDKQYPLADNNILQWSDDFKKILIYSTKSDERGEYYVYYPEEGRIVSQYVKNQFSITKDDYGKTKTVHYSSEDGVQHESYLTLPKGYKPGVRVPAVVMVHGGPWSRYYKVFDPEVAYFTHHGYAVLQVNFRGSEGFGTKYLQLGVGNLADLMIQDIADGARWMIQEGYANPDNVFIMGASYGGYAAIMSALKYPNMYKAAVSYAAPLDFSEQLDYLKKNKQRYAIGVWTELLGGGKINENVLRKQSPLTYIKNIKTPFLVFHGENDDVVPVSQAESLKKLVKKQKLNGEVLILEGEVHGFRYASNHAYFSQKTLNFFKSQE